MEACCPILIVDDDIVSRTLMSKQLQKAGFTVNCAGNGREALSILDECSARIVLTDWMMPEIDGTQLCRLIREKETDHYVFIILITSRDSKNDIVSGLESGADDYLIKPLHPAELIARINTGLRILKLEQSLKSATEEIRVLSITDPLTACFNRTYLNERLPQEICRSARYHRSLSILIADIDHFKKVNDTFGHQAGDHVLKLFSQSIQNQLRKESDWIVRYGGEEFLIILPETNYHGAGIISERLRNMIEKLEIEFDGKHIGITASFGGASVEFNNAIKSEFSMDQVIQLADAQLYASKQGGRNRTSLVTIQT